jgi:fibronectin type 3 domain-containing protein
LGLVPVVLFCATKTNTPSPVTENPGAPTGTVAAASASTSVVVSWNDGSSNEDSFRVERRRGLSSALQSVASVAANATAWQDTGLAANTAYTYRVVAVNAGGESAPSSEANVTTPPAPPAGVAATGGFGSVSLSWSGVTGATSYTVYRAATAGGPFAQVGTAAGVAYTDEGLADGATYYHLVRSVSAAGASEPSAVAEAATIPGVPTAVVAKAGSEAIELRWTSLAGATSVVVLRATTMGGPYAEVASSATGSFIDTGRVNGVSCFYVVRSANASGRSAASGEVSATPALVPPTGVAIVDGDREARLSWDAMLGATAYKVLRARASGGPYAEIATVTSPAHIDATIPNCTVYFYVVSAVYAAGTSANSAEVKVGGWSAPVAISPEFDASIAYPEIDIDPAGNVTAAWHVGAYNAIDVWANRFVPDAGWGAAAPLETVDPGIAGLPKVASDAFGTTHVVWQQQVDGVFHIFSRRFEPGAGWLLTTRLDSQDGSAEFPQIAVAPGGAATAVWAQKADLRWDFWSSFYFPDGGWSPAILLENDSDAATFPDAKPVPPSVASDPAGNTAVIWSIDGRLWLRRFSVATGWASEVLVNDGGGVSGWASVRADSLGDVHVAWITGGQFGPYTPTYRRFSADGGVGPAIAVGPDDAGRVREMTLSVNSTGTVFVMWLNDRWLSNRSLWVSRSLPGEGFSWATPIDVAAGGSWSSVWPFTRFVVDLFGNATATWVQEVNGASALCFNRFTVDAGWDDAGVLATNDGGSFASALATDAKGVVSIVWSPIWVEPFQVWSSTCW